MSTKENFDISTPTGHLQMTMMAEIAEFERAMILERQREGIAIAMLKGKYKEANLFLYRILRSIIRDILDAGERKHLLQKRLE